MHSGQADCTAFTKRVDYRVFQIGELIVSDLWGPAQVTGWGGFHYYVSFTDAVTQFSIITFLKEKSNAFQAYQQYESHLQTQYGKRIKCIHFDSRKEFLNDKMICHLRSQGTLYNTTAPHSSAQNGISK